MKLGKIKVTILSFVFIFVNTLALFSENTIETVPLVNLEELSPTFEEDKDELEKIDKNTTLNKI